jgi:hypothetical protein
VFNEIGGRKCNARQGSLRISVLEVIKIFLGGRGVKEWEMKHADNARSVIKDLNKTRLDLSFSKKLDMFSMQIGMEPYGQLGTGERCKAKHCRSGYQGVDQRERDQNPQCCRAESQQRSEPIGNREEASERTDRDDVNGQGQPGKRRSSGMRQLSFASEVISSSGKDKVKRWKLCRKSGLSYTFGQTREQWRTSLETFMNFNGS